MLVSVAGVDLVFLFFSRAEDKLLIDAVPFAMGTSDISFFFTAETSGMMRRDKQGEYYKCTNSQTLCPERKQHADEEC